MCREQFCGELVRRPIRLDEWVSAQPVCVRGSRGPIAKTAEKLDPDLSGDRGFITSGQHPDGLSDLRALLAIKGYPDAGIYDDHRRFRRRLFTRRKECGVL